jgi:hypothetical protein
MMGSFMTKFLKNVQLAKLLAMLENTLMLDAHTIMTHLACLVKIVARMVR